MYIFVVLAVLAAALGTSMLAFWTGADQIDAYYKQAASDNARNFASMVDGDYITELRGYIESDEYQQIRDKAEEDDDEQPIEDYLRENGLWEKYTQTQAMIDNYLENMDDLKYIYIVAHGGKDDLYDMYLIDDTSNPIYETGYYEEREEELRGIDLEKLPEPTISNGDWGWLCSDFKPLFNSKGECVGIVGCDFGMDDVMKERHQLLLYVIIGALALTVIVLTGSMIFINKVVIRPLDAMTSEMKKFKPEVNASYEEAGVISLDIRSRDEIAEIYQGIHDMQTDTIDQLNKMYALQEDKLKAEQDIRDKEKQIGKLSIESYKDALTGVGNKAAYIRKTEELDKSEDENLEFAIVMVDMNNLKQINDEHGHKAGDLYIKGCCRMVCEAFKHSPVFRIGGDEFVAVLKGKDYENRRQITEQLKAGFEKSYNKTDAEPWLRYSAAVGMAEKASDDKTVDFVFKRADKAMYENKMKFKELHGGYR